MINQSNSLLNFDISKNPSNIELSEEKKNLANAEASHQKAH